MTITEWHRSSADAGSYMAGWVASMLLHGSLAVGAVFFVQHVQLAPQLDPFKWDVTLVSSVSSPAQSSATSSAHVENPPPTEPTISATVPPAEPAPLAMKQKKAEPFQPQSSVMVAVALSTPPQQAEPQAAQPVPQTIAPAPQEVVKPIEPVPPATPVAPAPPVEPITHTPTAVESGNPSPQTAHSETSPIPHERESDSVVADTPGPPEPPTLTSPVVTASPAPVPSITPQITTSPTESPVSAASSATQLAALAPAGTSRPARIDYGWLSEVILRRVEELKRYPAEARMDRAEGKVVVKAVINADGSVDDVQIFQSSGSQTLDNAAVELMHRAAPFVLSHSLGKPRVTIMIPMNYRLDR